MQSDSQAKSVLIVVDMQTCYLNLYKDQDYPRSGIGAVNRAISEARAKGLPVIFTEHEFTGFWTCLGVRLLMKGAGIRGCDGFSTDPRIEKLETDSVYLKFKEDLFSVESLVERLRKEGVGRILLTGQDGMYCIKGSARGGRKLGYEVTVVDSGVLTCKERKWRAEKSALKSIGVRFASESE
jgi:nicotinamidase-related amidase